MEIRRIRPSDAEEVGRLHAAVWRDTYRGILSDAWLAAVSDDERIARWHAMLATPGPEKQWVAVVDGAIAGFVASGPARDDDAPRDLELWSIHVLPQHQGLGVGRHLVDVAIGDRPAYLHVLTANLAAQAFYRRLGFELDGSTSTVPYWENAPDSRMVR